MRLSAACSAAMAVSLTCAFALLASDACAQDPGRDLPAERVAGISEEDALHLGLERLQAGWNWEAARMFRELQVRDEDQPLPHLLMALAFRDVPNRAARLCFDAVSRRDNAGEGGKQVLDVYQAYFGVTDQPELLDARFQKAPDGKRHGALLEALAKLASAGSKHDLAGRLHMMERARAFSRTGIRDLWQDKEAVDALIAHNGYMRQRSVLPFMVPGYAELFDGYFKLSATQSAQLPRHPHHAAKTAPVRRLPGLKLQAAASGKPVWRPSVAKPFSLPRGVGGTGQFSDYAGKPVLIVFFLGFGCAHCVAQLADLDPKAPRFRDAGIDVITIGTDDLNAVKAARQAAAENGVDPLHFDVLCDPKGDVFKQWGVWDEFSDEALHGTFLVDGKGRILWQDVSLRPFEESDWLLTESKRLLAAWK